MTAVWRHDHLDDIEHSLGVHDDRWTEPPIDRSAYWQQEADLLRAHPGWWRDVKTCPTTVTAKSTARDIREGRVKAFRPAAEWDATYRGHVVKAVYLGPQTVGDA